MRDALFRSRVLLLFALMGTVSSAQEGSTPFSFVDLTYPSEALAARVSGVVVVRVTVGVDGRPEQVDTLSGADSLASAVVTSVKGWRFPAAGHATAVAFRFEIDPGACNDDRRSLFRLIRSNLAVVTACTRWGGSSAAQPVPSETMVAWGKPSYPDVPRSANLSGVAILDLSIDGTGRVLTASVLSASSQLFTDAALTHARTWTFLPGAKRRATVVYEFALDKQDCHDSATVAFWRVGDLVRLSACPAT